MDRLQLKMDAKAAMSQANPHPVLVTLIYTVIVAVIGSIGGMISGIGTIFAALLGDSDLSVLFSAGTLLTGMVVGLVIALVSSTLLTGYYAYCLKVINRQPAGINDLFAYIRYCLKLWGLSIVMAIFIWLWSLLFVIPGIIAQYRYSQALFIMAENPEKGILECISESKAMMVGHKMDKFVLDISFILWYLLAGVTCGIASLYVTPYVQITSAAFYNSIKPVMNNGYGGYNNYAQNPYNNAGQNPGQNQQF